MEIAGFTGLTEIGQGGFGVVYRATQEGIGREVAIKVITVPGSSLDAKQRRRFTNEAETTGQLSAHPHIMTLHDAGFTDAGQPYLVMAHMTGGSLADRLGQHGPLPPRDVADLMIKVAGALSTAHAAGIVHRDIKPDNILIDAYGAPVLGDFGIASVTGPDVTATATGQMTGTMAYTPPEVLDGQRQGPLTDVFALAATAFTLLAGHPPFVRDEDQTFTQVIARMLREDAPALAGYGVPEQMSTAIGRGVARAPEQRTHSALAFGQDLQEAQRALGWPETAMVLPQGTSAGQEDERTLALPSTLLDVDRPGGPTAQGVTAERRSAPTQAQTTPSDQAATPTVSDHPTPRPRDADIPPYVETTPAPRAETASAGYADPGWGRDAGSRSATTTRTGHRQPAPARRGVGWAPVIVGLILLAGVVAGGVLLALQGQEPDAAGTPSPVASIDTSATPRTAATASASVQPTPTATSTSPTPTAAPTPTSTPTPTATATATPAPDVISVDLLSAHQDASSLGQVLGVWGQGINDGDYQRAFGTYSPRLRDVVGFQQFEDGNATSTILDAAVQDVADDGDRRLMTITFTSTQDPSLGPDGQDCSVWRIRWTMIPRQDGGWLVDDADNLPGSPAPC